MKKLLLAGLFATGLLIPTLAPAQLLVFKGSSTDSYVGEGHTWHIASKMIIVVDYATGDFGRIDYTTFNHSKRYSTGTFTNAHLVQVSGPNGKPYTAVTRIPLDCAGVSTNTESVYFEGPNTALTVNGTSVGFPKTVSGNGRSLFYSTIGGQAVVSQGAFLGVFNSAETGARNNAGDTLDTAMAGYIANIEALGYSQ
jgi:hypothetical protein